MAPVPAAPPPPPQPPQHTHSQQPPRNVPWPRTARTWTACHPLPTAPTAQPEQPRWSHRRPPGAVGWLPCDSFFLCGVTEQFFPQSVETGPANRGGLWTKRPLCSPSVSQAGGRSQRSVSGPQGTAALCQNPRGTVGPGVEERVCFPESFEAWGMSQDCGGAPRSVSGRGGADRGLHAGVPWMRGRASTADGPSWAMAEHSAPQTEPRRGFHRIAPALAWEPLRCCALATSAVRPMAHARAEGWHCRTTGHVGTWANGPRRPFDCSQCGRLDADAQERLGARASRAQMLSTSSGQNGDLCCCLTVHPSEPHSPNPCTCELSPTQLRPPPPRPGPTQQSHSSQVKQSSRGPANVRSWTQYQP